MQTLLKRHLSRALGGALVALLRFIWGCGVVRCQDFVRDLHDAVHDAQVQKRGYAPRTLGEHGERGAAVDLHGRVRIAK
eukprot:scaffold965_cov262-Pinguiococcus_pyrenoidosus.AAC.5